MPWAHFSAGRARSHGNEEVCLVGRVSILLILLLFLTLFPGTPPAGAEEVPLDLDRVIGLALRNNGELQALRQEKGVREAERVRAGLRPNPSLEVGAVTGAPFGTPAEKTWSVEVSQEFLTAGKREKRIRTAQIGLAGYDHRIADAERLLIEEVKGAFYDYRTALERLEIARRSRAVSQELLALAQERFAAGDIPELEVNLARVEVARGEGRLAEVEREVEPARQRLLTLTGLPRGEEIRLAPPPEPRPLVLSLKELREAALAVRPDFKALEAEVRRGEAAAELARAERIPNLTAGLSYQKDGSSIDVEGREVKDKDDLVGVRLSVPIPLFDRNQAGVREARALLESAASRHRFARQKIEREVEAAYAQVQAAERALSLYGKDILPQLEENLRLVREAYRLGEVGILSVLEEQRKFLEVHEGYRTALYNRQTAAARLEAAAGIALDQPIDGGNK